MTKLEELLKELRDGKVVRFYKKEMFYRIQKSETMAVIVARPNAMNGTPELVENIQLTGFCSITEAETLIENLLK